MRIGTGFDVHRLKTGRKMIIGGIEIPFEKGLLGHSDADVLIHAIIDALLGAAAMGDIGSLFPDTDQQYKDADSLDLLRTTYDKITQSGQSLVNLDAVVMAEKPKLRPYIPMMVKKLAEALGTHVSQISIKATTTEKLGFVGREEGIAAQAVVLIQ